MAGSVDDTQGIYLDLTQFDHCILSTLQQQVQHGGIAHVKILFFEAIY